MRRFAKKGDFEQFVRRTRYANGPLLFLRLALKVFRRVRKKQEVLKQTLVLTFEATALRANNY